MVGLHRYVERRPVLERLAAGRRADGGFVATPLVRRDAFLGLGGLGVLEPSIVATLAAGLDDPYFEARTTAAGAVARLARTAAAPEPLAGLVDALSARLDDRTFEPRAAAARALGEVAGVDVVGALRRLYFDPVWMVRQAVFAALTRLVEREEITAAEARAEMDRVLITSAGYKIDYPLKDAYNRLRQAVAADAGEGD